jgi:beta-galactosidase
MVRLPVICIIILSLLTFGFSCSKTETVAREYISLSGDWLFATDPEQAGIREGWFQSGVPSVVPVDVPHTWNVDAQTENYYGKSWYEKEFELPAHWENKQVFIEFERVYHDAFIWINGKRAFEHIGAGYTTFKKEITELVQPGKKNRISVLVDNSPGEVTIPFMGSFDWAMDGGIIGHVDLYAAGNPAVSNVLVHSEYSVKDGRIEGQLFLESILHQSDDLGIEDLLFKVVITEENQATKSEVFSEICSAAYRNGKYYINIQLTDIKLWHFDDPNLYRMEFSPMRDGKLTDRFVTDFGFRKFEVRNGKLFMNGEQVRLAGVEWMPGSDPGHGFAEPEKYIEHVIDDMKDANCVFTRFHWQQSKKTIDYCNRMGILVQEEIPLWQQPVDFSGPPLSEVVERHAREMIFRDFNAPCIIAWGVGNELQSTNEVTKSSLLGLKSLVESIDSSRLVSYVSNHVGENPESDVSGYFDWIMMNDYYGSWFGKDASAAGEALDKIHALYPDKPIIISEWGLCEPRFTGGDERRIRDMKDHYAEYEKRPFVQGYIYFNYNDYRTHMGEEGEGKLRRRVHGVVDLWLQHKPSYNVLKEISSPLILTASEFTDEQLIIGFQNKNTIPSYGLRDYVVIISGASDNKVVKEEKLGFLAPGEQVRIEIPGVPKGEYRIEVQRGTGHNVLEQIVSTGN